MPATELRLEPDSAEPPEAQLGAWLRQAHPGGPVELVTRAGAGPLSARQGLQRVEDGVRHFGPQLRAALLVLPDQDGRPGQD